MTLALLTLLLATAPAQAEPAPPVSAPASDAIRFERVEYRDRIEKDGSQAHTLVARVRLGNAQGVAALGQIGLPYVDGLGEVQFEQVVIEKPDGRRVEVRDGPVEDINPLGASGASLPADVRFRRLTVPGLEPGDTLSYRIVVRRKPLVPGRVFGEHKFPALPGAPMQAYELDLPRRAGIRVRLREALGAAWEEVPGAPDRLVRRLSARVALPESPGELSPAERRSWSEPDVGFSSFESWEQVSRWWLDLSKGRLEPDASVAREAAQAADAARTPREKLAALLALVAQRVRYLNVSFGLGRMQPRAAPDVLRDRYGDCKDKHALLAALARSLGLDVRPVLIHSLRDELHDDVPGPQQFDHMIGVARLGASPSDWLWLDATNPFGPPGYLLPSLRDKPALLVESDGRATLVRTPKDPPFSPEQAQEFKGTLDAAGLLRGHVVWTLRSDDEVALRLGLSLLPQERLAQALDKLPGWQDTRRSNLAVSDLLDTGRPLRIEFDLEMELPEGGGERTLAVPFPEFELPDVPDPLPKDGSPVPLPWRRQRVAAEIGLPEGLNARLPLSVTVERPFASFRSTYALEERTLRLERTLATLQPSLSESDLPGWESFRKALTTDRKQTFALEGGPPGAPTAARLKSQGLAALAGKDYAHAAELLRQAVEADPKIEDGHNDLGRALRELGRHEDALAAFSRQIEATPYHESAYAWRAYELESLGRVFEAEKDLLKQIEVAPFKAWSYQRLARRRLTQARFAEAAELFQRATAIEPKEAEHWLELGQAQAHASRPEEARRALEQAVALDPPAWVKVKAAVSLRSLGDLPRAGRLAEAALPAVSRRLAGLAADSFGEDDLYWVERLAEAWSLVGEAAAAAGDVDRAERYLGVAWSVHYMPNAGWALGELREKQGRLAEAVDLWSMAAEVPAAAWPLPGDRQARIESACRRLPARPAAGAPFPPLGPVRPARQEEAKARFTELRSVPLAGPVVADLVTDVLLLADRDGRIEGVRAASSKDATSVERQFAKLSPARLAWPRLEGDPYKVVRRALLACSTATRCALVVDLPGMGQLATEEAGSVRFVSLLPAEGAELRPGQRVSLTATVACQMDTDSGLVALAVTDQSGRVLTGAPLVESVAGGEREVTFVASFDVPGDATRVDVTTATGNSPAQMARTVATARYRVAAR